MTTTLIIIIITAIISLSAFKNAQLQHKLLLWPQKMKNNPTEWYRLLTSGFVHGDTMHLAFNMITLFFFGSILEKPFFLGSTLYLILYLSGIVIASIPSMIKEKDNSMYRSLGASGGVAAVVFAMIYMNPWSKLYLFFAIPIPAILFAVFYLGYSVYMSKKEKQSINHDAHISGAIFGFLFMLIIDESNGMSFVNKIFAF